MSLSVCILVNQWHPKLPEAIASYRQVCSEILLGINGGFEPKNHPELIHDSHIKLIRLEWKGYGATKNELAAFAKNDWILSVDSDEVANPELQKSLANLRPEATTTLYAVGMCHYLGSKPVLHGSWKVGHRSFIRLYNRKHTSWDTSAVHETLQIPPASTTIRLKGRINHFTAQNYHQFLDKNRHYARLSAEKYLKQNKSVIPGKSWLSALFSFFKNYFFRLGFLDGKAGWQIAKGTALYTFWKYNELRNVKK